MFNEHPLLGARACSSYEQNRDFMKPQPGREGTYALTNVKKHPERANTVQGCSHRKESVQMCHEGLCAEVTFKLRSRMS